MERIAAAVSPSRAETSARVMSSRCSVVRPPTLVDAIVFQGSETSNSQRGISSPRRTDSIAAISFRCSSRNRSIAGDGLSIRSSGTASSCWRKWPNPSSSLAPVGRALPSFSEGGGSFGFSGSGTSSGAMSIPIRADNLSSSNAVRFTSLFGNRAWNARPGSEGLDASPAKTVCPRMDRRAVGRSQRIEARMRTSTLCRRGFRKNLRVDPTGLSAAG